MAGVSGGGREATTLESHPRRTLLLILGMHRSGTSAYTNMFALLGAALPRNLLSGNSSNEKGHFESARLLAEHDKMLDEIGSHWYDWNALSEDFFKSTLARTFAARFAEVVREEYGDAGLIVVKDPRICRFVPIWREVAALLDANIKIVTPFRNPMEVASSLRMRDNLPIKESLLVWTRHVLEAEFFTRDLPRAFIAYEALLGDWRSVIDQCSKEIGLTFPRRSPKAERLVDIYLDRGL
ncbi:MAG: sulfotransferase family protein, partial [Candidatus Acidiferrales bacterium]